MQIKRPISLAAIPSFYDQDLLRTRRIHADLMSESIRSHSVHRIRDVTAQYNGYLHKSTKIQEQRGHLQNQINNLHNEIRYLTAQFRGDYERDYTLAKQEWMRRKQDFDRKRAEQLFPSKKGVHPKGTPYTQQYTRTHDQMSAPVAQSLADIIDAVDQVGNGTVVLDKLEPFQPPSQTKYQGPIDPTTGETKLQRSTRLEKSLRAELDNLTSKLRGSEEDRLRAWRKLMKTKAELEMPHVPSQSRRHVEGTPLPHLHKSTPIHAPVVRAPTGAANYMPKYSAASVRDRISADGTVMPASQPRKTKDGLYQRPAGRTRKGMEWDTVQGRWVPEGTLRYHH